MSLVLKRRIIITLVTLYMGYNLFVYSSGTITDISITEQARNGRQVFQKYNCIACHQIYGLGGHMGPDLTNVIRDKGDVYARSFILSGTQRMPKFDISEQEVNDLIEYLGFVSSTSEYNTEKHEFTWYGTVLQNK